MRILLKKGIVKHFFIGIVENGQEVKDQLMLRVNLAKVITFKKDTILIYRSSFSLLVQE